MRSETEAREVFRLHSEGPPHSEISSRTGGPRTNVHRWLSAGLDRALNLPKRVQPCATGQLFSNTSTAILELFCEACDRVGAEWRQMNRRTISVARRDSVALLDAFIGPKR